MPNIRIANLREEIRLLERELGQDETRYVGADISALTEVVLELAAAVVDIAALDEKATVADRYDVSSLRRVLLMLRSTGLGDRLSPSIRDQQLTVDDELNRLDEVLAQIEAGQVEYGSTEAGLSLTLRADWILFCILMVTQDAAVIEELLHMVREALNKIDEGDLSRVWSRIQGEFDESRTGARLETTESAVPKGFFSPASVEETRDRIAGYIVRVKPQLAQAMRERGESRLPSDVVGVASVLAARTVVDFTPEERRILHCLARICDLWGAANRDRCAAILDIAADGWMCRSESRRRHTSSDKRVYYAHPQRMHLHLLDRLLLYLESYVSLESPVERALLQYKLGLEVTLPKSRNGFVWKTPSGKKEHERETEIQKKLCKFLLERNIFAFGTKFGRSEADLMLNQPGETFVIETKIYRNPPSCGDLGANLAQLSQYMDQTQFTSRGVLVVYNLSERTLVAERKWIAGRFWILAVNLAKEPPSSRRESLVVSEGTGGHLIDCVATHN